MFIILQFCIIALVTIKLDALTTNQSFLLAAYYIKKCISPEIVAYDKLSKPLGNCPSTIGAYMDCLNNTKNYTTNYHPCPYIYFESGVIPVFCNNGSWGKVDYFSYCVPITDEEQIRRKYELYYKLGIISQWQYQYKLDADSNIPIIKQLSYYLYIIDAVVCFFGFIVLLLLIPLKNCRVMLHRNLIFSIMMRDISRLIHLHLDIHPIDYHTFIFKGCSYAFLVLQYFNLVEIFWMFNEGFFQFRQFFFVFITKSYMWVYFVVGWLVPAVITFGIYLPLMLKYSILKKFTLCWSGLNDLRIYYAIIVPIFIIVAANILMLWYLMWIIVSKLKSGTGSEFEKSRRAARSFLLLAFLLGGGFIFVNTGPNNCIPFQYIQVILIAPQGIFVCVLQVFISKEVRSSARLKINRLKLKASIGRSTSKSTKGTTSTSIKKRISSGLFVRKTSNSKINGPQPMVNTSSNVVDNVNLQTCHSKNDLPTPGAQNEAFVNELQ